jgi:L-ascorbate metabolism protein UlaG (beta-lactamase superfamily)
MPVRITWLGHASVMIKATATVYIDPWKISKSSPRADIVLLTHDHGDHYSESDVKIISDASTRVVAPMSTKLVTDTIAPGQSLAIKDVTIKAVPAYNVSKAFHPKANAWVGYIVDIGGKKIYHTGDTDRIPEMMRITADLAFIPVGGTYTMDASEASEAVKDIKASIVIPIHFGDIVGSIKDAEKFAKLCACDVRILHPGESIDID